MISTTINRLSQGGHYVFRDKQPHGIPRSAVYSSIQGGRERRPSQSVQNQESLLREFVQQHRVSVYDTYIDDGWSGTNFDRPSFNRMIQDIEAKKVNMVITKDLSRLGRDYIMTGHYMERYFPEHRVRYISLLDGIDTGVDSTANDITPFRAIMNDMYAKDISKRSSRSSGINSGRGFLSAANLYTDTRCTPPKKQDRGG